MENLFIGLMSGTSVDSIDSALVNIDTGSFELLESSSSSIKKNLKKRKVFKKKIKNKCFLCVSCHSRYKEILLTVCPSYIT